MQRGVYVNVLPVIFGKITTNQCRGLVAASKSGGPPVAKKRKHGTGTFCTHNTPTKPAVLVESLTLLFCS